MIDRFENLRVECRSECRADERPVRFTWGERWLRVVEVCDRWYDPDADYFKVRADDGCLYLLRRDRALDRWSLRYVRTGEPSTPLVPPPPGAGEKPS
jgi:hypothetical protein